MVAANETSPEIKLAEGYRRGTFVASTSFVVQKDVESLASLCRILSRPRRDGDLADPCPPQKGLTP